MNQYQELARVGIGFLERVKIKGAEAGTWMAVQQMLAAIVRGQLNVTQPPAADPPDAPEKTPPA